MYAERKGWDLGEVEVEVDIEYEEPRADARFDVDPALAGGARPRSSASALLAIAGKCPVHRVLDDETEVDDRRPGRGASEWTSGSAAGPASSPAPAAASAARPRGCSAPRGPTCCWSPAARSGSPRRREEAGAAGAEAGGRAEAWPLDVTAEDAGERMLAAASERFGELDVLVNNAGTAQLARPRRGPRRGLARRSASST